MDKRRLRREHKRYAWGVIHSLIAKEILSPTSLTCEDLPDGLDQERIWQEMKAIAYDLAGRTAYLKDD
jgi:hypothetical protein